MPQKGWVKSMARKPKREPMPPEAYSIARTCIRTVWGYRRYLTVQEMHTLRGQALAGDVEGAYRGLETCLERAGIITRRAE